MSNTFWDSRTVWKPQSLRDAAVGYTSVSPGTCHSLSSATGAMQQEGWFRKSVWFPSLECWRVSDINDCESLKDLQLTVVSYFFFLFFVSVDIQMWKGTGSLKNRSLGIANAKAFILWFLTSNCNKKGSKKISSAVMLSRWKERRSASELRICDALARSVLAKKFGVHTLRSP